MPLFLIEREFAERLEVTAADVQQANAVYDSVGAEWILSFLSADQKKTYCLYEAPSAEVLLESARRLDLPADAVVEVSRMRPSDFA